MSKNIKYAAFGALAAVALATATSGSTLAAWAKEGDLTTAGTVTAGFLDLKVEPAVGSQSWIDLTPAKGETNPKALKDGTPIANISDYRMVPGSVIAYAGKVKVGLDGDNLHAKLTGSIPQNGGASGDLLTTNNGATAADKGVSASAELYKWNKSIEESTEKANLDSAGSDVCSKQADTAGAGQGCSKGVLDKAGFDSGTEATHLAVVKLTFDKDATSKQNKTLTLQGIKLSLKQVAPAQAS